MKTKATTKTIRDAVARMFGANKAECENYIKSPEDDTGGWAEGSPGAVAVIYLEPDGRFPEDQYKIPDALGYWSGHGLDNCIRLGQETGTTVEYYNAAVAVVYE